MESVLWGSAHGPTVGGWEIAARYSWAVEPSSCSRPGHEAGAGTCIPSGHERVASLQLWVRVLTATCQMQFRLPTWSHLVGGDSIVLLGDFNAHSWEGPVFTNPSLSIMTITMSTGTPGTPPAAHGGLTPEQ